MTAITCHNIFTGFVNNSIKISDETHDESRKPRTNRCGGMDE